MEYYFLIKSWLVDVLTNIVNSIKNDPINLIADIILYVTIIYISLAFVKKILNLIFVKCNIDINQIKKYTNIFKIHPIKIDQPIHTLLCIVQSISLIIAIIFSENVTNIIQLNETKSQLHETELELLLKNKELKKTEIELSLKNEELNSILSQKK